MTIGGVPLYQEYRALVEKSAAAWFRGRSCDVEGGRPYVLACHDQWRDNIILEPEVYPTVEDVRPLHTMVHHGLSSQALAFNLFGPLLVRKDWEPAKPAFEAAGVRWPVPECVGRFEYGDPDVFGEKDQNQPTSWDLALGPSGKSPSILVEVKFVEHDLGACSVFSRGDCNGANPARDHDRCYLHVQKKRCYLTVARKHGLLESAAFSGPICPFTIYYQFFREVMFAAEKGASMVYVLDDRNPALYMPTRDGVKGLIPYLLTMLPASIARCVSVVPIRNIVSAIEATGRHGDWVGEFRKKYRFEGGAA